MGGGGGGRGANSGGGGGGSAIKCVQVSPRELPFSSPQNKGFFPPPFLLSLFPLPPARVHHSLFLFLAAPQRSLLLDRERNTKTENVLRSLPHHPRQARQNREAPQLRYVVGTFGDTVDREPYCFIRRHGLNVSCCSTVDCCDGREPTDTHTSQDTTFPKE